jgi:hypothetical protein
VGFHAADAGDFPYAQLRWHHPEDYPEVRRPADSDTDGDGIPRAWERQQGLNPDDPADGAADANGDGYTNLEDYLNWLAAGNRLQ